MKNFRVFALIMIAAILVSGCTQYGGQTQNTTPTPPQTPGTPEVPPTPPPIPQENIEISVVTAPQTARVGEPVNISWKVSGAEKTISHTAIHYDYTSHPGTFGSDIGPQASEYLKLTSEYASGSFNIPNTFSAIVIPYQAGTLYYRAHAIVDGKNYWTDEKSISIAATQPPVATVDRFSIDADDSGYYSDSKKISSIAVTPGKMVNITFNVLSTNVYHGGLDFRGCGANIGAKPGESTSLEFSPTATCTITSYWPLTGISKAELDVTVGAPASTSSGGGY